MTVCFFIFFVFVQNLFLPSPAEEGNNEVFFEQSFVDIDWVFQGEKPVAGIFYFYD